MYVCIVGWENCLSLARLWWWWLEARSAVEKVILHYSGPRKNGKNSLFPTNRGLLHVLTLEETCAISMSDSLHGRQDEKRAWGVIIMRKGRQSSRRRRRQRPGFLRVHFLYFAIDHCTHARAKLHWTKNLVEVVPTERPATDEDEVWRGAPKFVAGDLNARIRQVQSHLQNRFFLSIWKNRLNEPRITWFKKWD